MKEKIGKMDFIKIKNYSEKDIVKRMEGQTKHWKKKYLQKPYLTKAWYPKYTKNS